MMKATLKVARAHEVTIDSSYAALVIGVCVLVGFATALDPGTPTLCVCLVEVNHPDHSVVPVLFVVHCSSISGDG